MTRLFESLTAILLGSALVLTGCVERPNSSGNETDKDQKDRRPSWSYEGRTGPRHWADLSSDSADCGGDTQSPIDLFDARPPSGPTHLKMSYTTEEAEVVDAGPFVQINTSGGTLTINGATYVLQQVHVHVPSEHTIQGHEYAAEIHLVHRAEETRIAVLGLLVEDGGAPHPALNAWIQAPDTTLLYNAGHLLPSRRSYYTYDGSLTTPPCTEGVRWIVMNTPLSASSSQLESLRTRYDGTARPIQPRGGRSLVLVAP